MGVRGGCGVGVGVRGECACGCVLVRLMGNYGINIDSRIQYFYIVWFLFRQIIKSNIYANERFII